MESKASFEFKIASRTRVCDAELSIREFHFSSSKFTRVSIVSSSNSSLSDSGRTITCAAFWTHCTDGYKTRSSGKEEEIA
jgi:hypothetical protein